MTGKLNGGELLDVEVDLDRRGEALFNLIGWSAACVVDVTDRISQLMTSGLMHPGQTATSVLLRGSRAFGA